MLNKARIRPARRADENFAAHISTKSQVVAKANVPFEQTQRLTQKGCAKATENLLYKN